MTGNGNDVNLLKLCLEKIVKSHQCNLFSARFSHLEPIMWPTLDFVASIFVSVAAHSPPLLSRLTAPPNFFMLFFSLWPESFLVFILSIYYILTTIRQIDKQRDCECPRTLPATPGDSPVHFVLILFISKVRRRKTCQWWPCCTLSFILQCPPPPAPRSRGPFSESQWWAKFSLWR